MLSELKKCFENEAQYLKIKEINSLIEMLEL